MSDAVSRFVIGVDFGSNSARAVVVNVVSGEEVASAVSAYPGGDQGVYGDPSQPSLARQDPADYLYSLERCAVEAIRLAGGKPGFAAGQVIGIGVDTTGSTPIPVTAALRPLSASPRFKNNPNAFAWMWKDHTAHDEAEKITALAAEIRPRYLSRCGETYSSEWFWSKLWHCRNVAPDVFAAADNWVEFCDFIPATLCGVRDAQKVRRSVCAAGHKAMYCREWGGLPDKEFLARLHPDLAATRDRLYEEAFSSDRPAGNLCPEWAKKLGLPVGIPVAVGAFDCHFGAVGVGVAPGVLVKIIGTSSCDLMVVPLDAGAPRIKGVCGIVEGSVLPGWYGVEAGQSAVGDIFAWFAKKICRSDSRILGELGEEAENWRPGQSGLLALDWHNGNRCVLVDPGLSGLILGLTLQTGRAEIYRALIEATAFGARKIMERVEETGVRVKKIVCSGGIARKSPLLAKIYADALNRELDIADSDQACALGAAIFAATVAGARAGGYDRVEDARKALSSPAGTVYRPTPEHARVYDRLYRLYGELHDSFGVRGGAFDHASVMKELLAIHRETTRA